MRRVALAGRHAARITSQASGALAAPEPRSIAAEPGSAARRGSSSSVASNLSRTSLGLPAGVLAMSRGAKKSIFLTTGFNPYRTKFTQIGRAEPPAKSAPPLSGGNEQLEDNLDFIVERIKIALADSGLGGGMTTAKLEGMVRQLGCYFCLPIGDKSRYAATAYTAMMALWPLIAPLANSRGENDHQVPDHVIVACNSASVRVDDALDLMAKLCDKVAAGAVDTSFLGAEVLENAIELNKKIKADPQHLQNHVHEIVSLSANRVVETVLDGLRASDSQYFRIDSTNGTANSRAYPDRMLAALRQREKDGGITDLNVRTTKTQTYNVEGHDATIGRNGSAAYQISYDIFTFKVNGVAKVFVSEGRGNPPWVPHIEGNKVTPEMGQTLARQSAQATEQSKKDLPADLSPEVQRVVQQKDPDGIGLFCTHYPAMKESLEAVHGASTTFINQAQIVEELVNELDPQPPKDGKDPLNLFVTVGSQNYGGVPEALKKSVPDGDASARMLRTVLEKTQQSLEDVRAGSDRMGTVKMFDQTAPIHDDADGQTASFQDQFEGLHALIGAPIAEQILAEQNLKIVERAQPRPTYELIDDSKLVRPHVPLGSKAKEIAESMPPRLKVQMNQLGNMTILGETRGMSVVGVHNAQGEQLRTMAARMVEVVEANAKRAEGEPEQRVGIATGFTVIDNATGERAGGENDGPPGAVAMARVLLKRGAPITLMTDQSAQASLVSALIGAGLAEVNGASKGKPPVDLTLGDLTMLGDAAGGKLKFEVPEFDNTLSRAGESESERSQRLKEQQVAVWESVENLRESNVTTMISIERPSPTKHGTMTSMLAADVSPFNLDLTPVLDQGADDGPINTDPGAYRPFSFGIGDGGNEWGTARVSEQVANLRTPDLKSVVPRGEYIAAAAKTDGLLLSSVSNLGGVTAAMAFEASFERRSKGIWDVGSAQEGSIAEERLRKSADDIMTSFGAQIDQMHGDNLSLDGVNKLNLKTVDGRRMGTYEEAKENWARAKKDGKTVTLGRGPTKGVPEGTSDDTSHMETMMHMRNFIAPYKDTEFPKSS